MPASRRLGVVARFGVGYDTVDVEALADAGGCNRDHTRRRARPVAVSILALILALMQQTPGQGQLARQGAAGFAEPSAPIGVGITGKTLGTIGLGNMAAEMVAIMRPLGLTFIAHDPNVKRRGHGTMVSPGGSGNSVSCQ